MRAFVNRRISYGNIAVFMAIAVATAFWSIVGIMRYDTFNANVLDLGVNSSLLYGVFHPAYSSPDLAMNKLIYLVIAPFYNLWPDPKILIVFQATWLSLGAYPLYSISKKIIGGDGVSLALASSYLLYFPLGGVYWFDFHYMALFPTFFLFAIMFYIGNRTRLFIIFTALAAISDLLVPIMILFMALSGILLIRKYGSGNNPRTLIIPAVSISVLALAAITLYVGPDYIYNWMNRPLSPGFFAIVESNFLQKWEYFLWLFVPVFFLCLMAPRVLLMIVPYILLVFAHDYSPYFNPMYFQYPALTAPIIFLATTYGIKNVKRLKLPRWVTVKRIAVAVLLCNVAFTAFYSPIGGAIIGTHSAYNVGENITFTPEDAALDHMISMIPGGSSVLIQGNMPQLTNGYHWELPTQFNKSNLPQYAVSDPYSYFYYNGVHISGNEISNFQQDFQYLMNSGKYHVVDSEYNITLIEINH